MPGSPTTRNDRPRPPTASPRPARTSTSSWCRPTKTASVRWWGGGIAEIIPLSRVHGKDGMPPPASRSSRDGHHTPEFEGAAYSLVSMVMKFVKAPVLAYQPNKGGEADPDIELIFDRVLRYIRYCILQTHQSHRGRLPG